MEIDFDRVRSEADTRLGCILLELKCGNIPHLSVFERDGTLLRQGAWDISCRCCFGDEAALIFLKSFSRLAHVPACRYDGKPPTRRISVNVKEVRCSSHDSFLVKFYLSKVRPFIIGVAKPSPLANHAYPQSQNMEY